MMIIPPQHQLSVKVLAWREKQPPLIGNWPVFKILDALYSRNISPPTGISHAELFKFFIDNYDGDQGSAVDLPGAAGLAPPKGSAKKLGARSNTNSAKILKFKHQLLTFQRMEIQSSPLSKTSRPLSVTWTPAFKPWRTTCLSLLLLLPRLLGPSLLLSMPYMCLMSPRTEPWGLQSPRLWQG